MYKARQKTQPKGPRTISAFEEMVVNTSGPGSGAGRNLLGVAKDQGQVAFAFSTPEMQELLVQMVPDDFI